MFEKIYTTDLKFIIPLIGIIVAWILTSAGNFYKNLNTNNKVIGKALVQLYFFYLERRKLLRLFEFLKDVQGIGPDYEANRKRYVERYALSDEARKAAMDSINEVSSLYPFIGFKLKHILEAYALTQKMSFKATETLDSKTYIKMLSLYEVGLELENKLLKEIILKLAFKRGIFTFLRMHWTFYKLEKRSEEGNIIKELGLDKDTIELLKKADNPIKTEQKKA